MNLKLETATSKDNRISPLSITRKALVKDHVNDHAPDAIRARLAEQKKHSYLGDAVLGGIDGCVTTFAIVTGAIGAGFSTTVVIILGVANLLADGFSMAVSNYQGTKSEHELLDEARASEERHIEQYPQGEREEIRQIFMQKGFSGEVLEEIVTVITEDKTLWVDTMLTEELGLRLQAPSPLRAAIATFMAFLVVGLVPLLPFLLPIVAGENMFAASVIATSFAFLAIGMTKGKMLNLHIFKSGLETLFVGGAAAGISYLVGYLLQGLAEGM